MPAETEPKLHTALEQDQIRKYGANVSNWESFSEGVSYRDALYDLFRIEPETRMGIYRLSREDERLTGKEPEFIMINEDGVVVKEGAGYYETEQNVR